MLGIDLFLSFWDIQKFFDKENLRDCMDSVHQAGVESKISNLWFMLNKKTQIRVLTGLGVTEYKHMIGNELVGQGTQGGALISGLNIDRGVNDYFENSNNEVCYGSVRLQPVLFQDDVVHMSTSRMACQAACSRMEAIMKSKQLLVHPSKSCIMISASKNNISRIKSEIKNHPIIYDDFEMKVKNEAKYLGDWMSEGGNSSSACVTIGKRKGRAITAIHEIGAILQDIRLHAIGGLMCGLDIYNMAIIPTLLYNSEMFTEMSKDALGELEEIQRMMLSVLLAVPLSCPRPALAWDTATMSMQNRIHERKLNLIVHIISLDESALAKQIYMEQRKHEWPGLSQEGKSLCREMYLPDITKETNFDAAEKRKWKRRIKEAVDKKNEKDLRESFDGYSKLDQLIGEEFDVKTYLKEMHMTDARMFFRMRTEMFNCKMNRSSDRQNRVALWQCSGCGNIDTQAHIIWCPAYQDLREGKSLNSNTDLVHYFKKVMQIRETLDLG